MKLLDLTDLTYRQETERTLLQFGAFSSYFDRHALDVYRRRSKVLAEYVGLVAVDRGSVVGHTVVLHLPYTAPEGVETVAGIATVTTATGSARRGIARALLTEAHRRERESGLRFAMLWTSSSWHAHRLYESLGYRDVYVPPLAVHRSRGPRPLPAGESLRPARPQDLAELEAAFDAYAVGRIGFVPRPPRVFRIAREAGDLTLENLLVYRRHGRIAGYAYVGRGSAHLSCGEMVAAPGDRVRLYWALERRSPGGVTVLGNTPVLDLEGRLRAQSYLVRGGAEWRSLMACSLDGGVPAGRLAAELGTGRPEFSCLSLDRF